jgi:hypothetical protein
MTPDPERILIKSSPCCHVSTVKHRIGGLRSPSLYACVKCGSEYDLDNRINTVESFQSRIGRFTHGIRRIIRTDLPKSSASSGLSKLTGHCEFCHRRHASSTINGRLVCLRKRCIQRASIHIPLWMKLTTPILFGLVLMALGLPETKWLLFAAGITLHQTTTMKLKTVRPTSRDIHDARSSLAPQGDTEHVIERRSFLKMAGCALLGVLIARSLPSVLADTLIPIRRLAVSDASYVIFVDSGDGNKIKVKNVATGEIKFSSTDGGLVMQKSIDALPSGGIIFMQPGTYIWSTVPALPPSLPSWLRIVGDSQTVIRLTNQAPRAFDLNAKADNQTFQYIGLEGFTVDCNNTGGIQHVVIGSMKNGGGWTRPVNIQDIIVANVKTINVPSDPSGATTRGSIYFSIYNAGTQNSFLRIYVEDCDFNGGNYGVIIDTNKNSNTYMDEIHFLRCKHDTGLVPTDGWPLGAANFYIGPGGWGHYAHFQDCKGLGSGDVGFEVNNFDYWMCEDCEAVNAVFHGFYQVNYQTGFVATQQLSVFRNCVADNSGLSQSARADGFCVACYYPIPLGDFVYDNCQYYTLTSGQGPEGSSAGFRCYGNGGMVRSLTYKNCKITIDNVPQINGTPTYIVGMYVDTKASNPSALLNIENLDVRIRGSKTASGNLYVRGLVIQGNLDLNVNGVLVDESITGIQSGGQSAMLIGSTSSLMKGTIRGLSFISANDAGAVGLVFASKSTLTLSPGIGIQQCNFSGMSAGSEYYFTPISVAPNVSFTACVSRTGSMLT